MIRATMGAMPARKAAPRKRTRRTATARRTVARKTAAAKANPLKATPGTARVAQATPGNRGPMSSQHKRALAAGREEGRAVRAYLEALEAHKPRRGRKRTEHGIRRRLNQIDAALPDADPLSRVHLSQERLDLESELGAASNAADMQTLENGFIAVARSYGDRKGLSYAAWRTVGVDANVLLRAGISRRRA
jgi:hypothetical protein